MTRFALLLLFGAAAPAVAADMAKPAALTADGVPPVPTELAAATRSYMEMRSAVAAATFER